MIKFSHYIIESFLYQQKPTLNKFGAKKFFLYTFIRKIQTKKIQMFIESR